MRRLRWLMVLSGCLWLLAACGGNNDVEQSTPETPPTVNATVTFQPTLDINAIPILGEENPPPPIPLEVNDSRYPIPPAVGDVLTKGKRLYGLYCAACHGPNGEGQQPDPYVPEAAPPHNDTGHTSHHADQQNFGTVWYGRSYNGTMPAFHARMTPDEIISVLAYIKLWWTEDQLATQMGLSQRMVDGVSGASGE